MREVQRLLPSLEMGEYSPAQERPEDGGLYPLEEEGTYGRVPKRKSVGRWTAPQGYVRRERRTKMYASYAISDKCELHSLLLDKYDRRSSKPRNQGRNSRAASAPPEYQKEDLEQNQRGQSLPPKLEGSVGNLETLDMINRLQLSKEVEEDTRETLRSILGEEDTVGQHGVLLDFDPLWRRM